MRGMRFIAVTPEQASQPRRVMIYDTGEEVYLFLFRSLTDRNGYADQWFETVEQAKEAAWQAFGVAREDWQPLADPLPGQAHDSF